MKQGQIELQFNWIFIMIAGAAILFFFFTLISQQRTVSEERLQRDVTRIIENIFVGAGVSEKTKNLITIPPQYEFYFTCNDEKEIREFGIIDSDARRELPQEPIFAPATIQASRLITWSLPVQLPYKVADILMVTAPTIKYVVVTDESGFARELEKDVRPSVPEGPEQPVRIQEGLNFDFVSFEQLDREIGIGNNNHLRLVFLTDQPQLPPSLRNVPDEKISAVRLTGGSVEYYRKKGNRFERTGLPVSIPYVGSGKQSLRLAAIFVEDAVTYNCNLRKVFGRARLMNVLYQQKAKDLVKYYQGLKDAAAEQSRVRTQMENCEIKSRIIQEKVNSLTSKVNACLVGHCENTADILASAQEVDLLNHHPETGLSKICPIALY